jgi:hypothetical protein
MKNLREKVILFWSVQILLTLITKPFGQFQQFFYDAEFKRTKLEIF